MKQPLNFAHASAQGHSSLFPMLASLLFVAAAEELRRSKAREHMARRFWERVGNWGQLGFARFGE